GKFKGLRGENAINEFYRALETHAKNLIKDAKVFRLISYNHLTFVLNNWDRKFPTTLKCDSYNISKNQAMYGSSEFPIHAYMSDSENGTLPPNRKVPIKDMGNVALRLKKDHVMGRATLAFDDTMSHYWEVANELTIVPRPMTQLDRKIWPLTKWWASGLFDDCVDKAVLSQVENPLAVRRLGDLDNYPEVQIHGDLKLSDVEKIFVPPDFKEIPSLLQQLDECGIEWEYL
ncbi:MAG TPA: hypothetical protein VHV10_18780, partial [Ktedonobacteraceae bacterium]|nr:hypothetical protein [Ktedonobacteraceae bacterium]